MGLMIVAAVLTKVLMLQIKRSAKGPGPDLQQVTRGVTAEAEVGLGEGRDSWKLHPGECAFVPSSVGEGWQAR